MQREGDGQENLSHPHSLPSLGRIFGHQSVHKTCRSCDSYQVSVLPVSDGDDDFPIKNTAVRGCIKRMVQRRGMSWYKLSDLTAEAKALGQCMRNEVDIIHYLDGEHSAQYLPRLVRNTDPAEASQIRCNVPSTR